MRRVSGKNTRLAKVAVIASTGIAAFGATAPESLASNNKNSEAAPSSLVINDVNNLANQVMKLSENKKDYNYKRVIPHPTNNEIKEVILEQYKSGIDYSYDLNYYKNPSTGDPNGIDLQIEQQPGDGKFHKDIPYTIYEFSSVTDTGTDEGQVGVGFSKLGSLKSYGFQANNISATTGFDSSYLLTIGAMDSIYKQASLVIKETIEHDTKPAYFDNPYANTKPA